LARRRRLLAAGLLAGSAACAISAVSPAPPPRALVAAAAHDLAGGTTITAGDLRMVKVPPESLPAGAITDEAQLTGRLLAVPVRAGETITDVRLVGPTLLAGDDDRLVAAPVRIADAGSAALLRPGDVIDVLAADGAGGADGGATGGSVASEARLVASDVRVVAIPRDHESALSGGGFAEGALVVLATTSQTAARLASAAVTARLSLTINAG
jgi:pilus assembly protein CpaB